MTDEPRLRATIGVPGLPYSQLYVYDGDDHGVLMEVAGSLLEHYEAAGFRENVAPLAPQHQQAPSRPAQSVSGQSGVDHPYPVRVYCPKHGVEMQPSIKNKTLDETDYGPIAASWMHRDGDGWCSVYQSKARVEAK